MPVAPTCRDLQQGIFLRTRMSTALLACGPGPGYPVKQALWPIVSLGPRTSRPRGVVDLVMLAGTARGGRTAALLSSTHTAFGFTAEG